MHNGVVEAITRALASRGVVALRFNFRGVGGSEGVHDNGLGEQDDVAGAQNWLLAQPDVDPGRVSLVGYSFGSCVALARAYADRTVSAFAAVGLAVDFCDPELMRRLEEADQVPSHSGPRFLTCPKLFITGERDQLAPPGRLRRLVECLPDPKMLQIVPGADHFWWGSEKQVGEVVANFLTAR
jgi:alpha/beta superfamily hydrolase